MKTVALSRTASDLVILAALAAIYFVAGKIGLRLAFVNASATPEWPSAGIGLAAFLILGYRVWPAILLASLWKGYPYMCLMLLAGLQTIPEEVYEAADVDGATGFRRLWYVTLPLLKPVASIVTLVALVLTWNNFQMIWVLTEGGPAYATSVLATYVYTKGFVFFQLGSGSAVATLSILVILFVCVIYAWMMRLEEREP